MAQRAQRRLSVSAGAGSAAGNRRGSLIPTLSSAALNRSELGILREETQTGVHFLTPKQIERIFRTDLVNGLSEDKARELLEKNGPNQLQELKSTSYWKVFRENLFGWFQCVLWCGAILNVIAYIIAITSKNETVQDYNEYLYLAVIITVIILGTGLFGFYQEAKNLKVMSGFEKLVPPNAVVIREGIQKIIPNNELVVGDLVEMSGGDIVPADVRILTVNNFKTDQASLTGESVPVEHSPDCTHENPLESHNMAYFSCPITEGNARGIVVDTGQMTQIGKIAGLVTGLEKEETPISKEITHFIKLVCGIAFVFGIAFFLMVYFVEHSWIMALQYMLGIILANVPEGLIVTLTVCLTLSAKQLRKKNCLAKTLQAVETLGSTSAICSDKTGTLTINRMTVSHLFSNFKIYDKDDFTAVSLAAYAELCLAATLNLKAKFTHDTMHLPIDQRSILGDASESAILRYMEKNRSASQIRSENPVVAEIPFNSAYKYQVTIHNMQATHTNYLIMKGAPEIILEFCVQVMTDTGIVPLTAQVKKELKENFIKLANMGERVLGYGTYHLPVETYPLGFEFDTKQRNFPLEDLVFIGALSMIDPPRPEVKDAIAMCKQAGIRVTMVTGDHPVTALSISRKIGIITMPTAYDYAFEHHIEVTDVPFHMKNQFQSAVFTGEELRTMTSVDLKQALKKYKEITFARTSPQQKLFIVESYQALQYVVAATGDGVNDSPALKKADIGIAMGITGTEVSKRAADMILLDDNFASIVLGIEEGRRIFDNLKKTIAYTLTSNTPEMFPFVLYALMGIPLPLSLMLMLVINVGTDLFPAMSLAYETSEQDIMKIPPRRQSEHLVNRVLIFMAYYQIGLVQLFAGMYSYYCIMAQNGFFPASLMYIKDTWEDRNKIVYDSFRNPWNFDQRLVIQQKAQTAYFVSIILTQISDVIICKTRRISLWQKGMRNHILNASIIVNIILILVVTYVPFCHTIFGTNPLRVYNLFLSVPFMVLMIGADELRRYAIRHNLSKWLEAETYY